MAKLLFFKTYSEIDYVKGINDVNRTVRNRYAEAFYKQCSKYFRQHFRSVFFKGEEESTTILNDSFLLLWCKIDSGSICVKEDRLYINGQPATSNLMTFLLSIAKNKYREWVREHPRIDNQEYLTDLSQIDAPDEPYDKTRDKLFDILHEKLSNMSKDCFLLLTLFYYKEMKLEQILTFMRNYANTNSLKTKKSRCLNNLREKMEPYKDLYKQ